MSLTWPQWPGITIWPLIAGPTLGVAGEHVVPPAGVSQGGELWTHMTAANPRLFDGPILSLESFEPAGGRVMCRRSSYKWLAVQDHVETGVTLVAVNGVVTARDGAGREHYLLARRSSATWKYGGMWELSPAGGLEPTTSDGPVSSRVLVEHLRRELAEEAGFDDPLTDARPIGFYRDAVAHSFNVILRARLSRPLETVRAAMRGTHWDADATRWVARDELAGFAATGRTIAASRAILEWLTGSRGQTSFGSTRNPTG